MPAPTRTAALTWWRHSLLGRHLLVAALGLLVVVAVLESVSDFRNVQLASMAYLGIAAGGLTVLTGLNGQLSLGHGALMAVGAYTTALCLPGPDAVVPLPVAVLASVLVTLLVGALVGVAAARLHGPYLAGATLALAVAVPGLALFFEERLGGEQGLRVALPEIPAWVLDLAFFVTGQELTRSRYVAYLGWLTLLVTFVLLANLSRSRVGRRWRAVRDGEVAAELAGIRLGQARVSAFVVSAAAAGAAGAMMAISVRLAAPSGFTLTLSLTLLTAVVLGGLGSLAGALVGAALLTFLPQLVTRIGTDAGLSDIQAAELSPLVYGLVMVLVVLLAPAGLVGTLRLALLRRRARRPASPVAGIPDPRHIPDSPGPSDSPGRPAGQTHDPATTSKGHTS
ncbi:branched-chain amino acid ABC transporter permease [Nocardioides ferulae]|uniref:branched-chain amino acid ABC transporter permease n=1 Tax=Nocardioides ferulae TaxID=2340821 RepID=UPI000EB29CE0|nr:branched-chain amino acid ABC transporter permease [Nocardioides ferulae]